MYVQEMNTHSHPSIFSLSSPYTAPSGVPNPQLLALSSSSVSVRWFNPSVPNGLITAYNVYTVSGLGRVRLTTSGVPGSFVVQDLLPATQYSFVVEACTSAGCQASGVSSVTTLASGKCVCVCTCGVCVYVCICVCARVMCVFRSGDFAPGLPPAF